MATYEGGGQANTHIPSHTRSHRRVPGQCLLISIDTLYDYRFLFLEEGVCGYYNSRKKKKKSLPENPIYLKPSPATREIATLVIVHFAAFILFPLQVQSVHAYFLGY